MTRGLTDPVMDEPEESMGDLPTIEEMDMAIRQLYEIQSEMNTKIQVLTDLLGSAIASNNRTQPAGQITGL